MEPVACSLVHHGETVVRERLIIHRAPLTKNRRWVESAAALNARVSLRRADEILSSPQSCWIWPTPQTIRPCIPRDQGSPLPSLGAAAPPRLVSVFYVQSPPELFWLTLDHVMPEGPPAFLTFIILLLAILNGITALSRW
jgi:hypothetical protein